MGGKGIDREPQKPCWDLEGGLTSSKRNAGGGGWGGRDKCRPSKSGNKWTASGKRKKSGKKLKPASTWLPQ